MATEQRVQPFEQSQTMGRVDGTMPQSNTPSIKGDDNASQDDDNTMRLDGATAGDARGVGKDQELPIDDIGSASTGTPSGKGMARPDHQEGGRNLKVGGQPDEDMFPGIVHSDGSEIGKR